MFMRAGIEWYLYIYKDVTDEKDKYHKCPQPGFLGFLLQNWSPKTSRARVKMIYIYIHIYHISMHFWPCIHMYSYMCCMPCIFVYIYKHVGPRPTITLGLGYINKIWVSPRSFYTKYIGFITLYIYYSVYMLYQLRYIYISMIYFHMLVYAYIHPITHKSVFQPIYVYNPIYTNVCRYVSTYTHIFLYIHTCL